MNQEFAKLYDDWHNKTMFLSVNLFNNDEFKKLEEWGKANKDELRSSMKELLLLEPTHIIHLMDVIFPDELTYENFVPLDAWCCAWYNILNNTIKNPINIYKDYNEYQKYLESNYISWNPFKENDPNVTFEEYKQGKRNPK